MLNAILNFFKKKQLQEEVERSRKKVEEAIQSGKTQSERDNLRALSLTFNLTKGQSLSVEDENWLENHNQKEKEKKRKSEERKKEKEQKRKLENKKYLIDKYGEEIGTRLFKQELWVGMSSEMVIDSKGRPHHKIEKVSRGKKREEYFYDGYKNRQGNMSYKFRVVLIDGKVDGWNDITN